MNGNMRKRIMAILLSGAICVSNCTVPSFASGVTFDPVVESEAGSEQGSSAAGIVEENQGESENAGLEHEDEDGENVLENGNSVSGAGTDQNVEENGSGEIDNTNVDNTVDDAENTTENISVDEKLDNAEEDSSAENAEEGSVENPEENLMTMAAVAGTFDSIDELKTYYNANKENEGFINALDFSAYNNKEIGANANGLILLSCVENESFEGWTIKVSGLSGSGATLTNEINGFTFRGLGRSTFPFKGTITVSGASSDTVAVILDTPFFNALDVTSAKLNGINTLKIQTAQTSGIALAETVCGTGQDWSSVEVQIEAYKHVDNESVTYTYPGSCIGTVKSGTDFSLKKIYYGSTANVNISSGNAGLLCNTMEEGAKFTVHSVQVSTNESVKINVTSGNAAAGGLIGYINENAEFFLGDTEALTIDAKWTITGKNAGGMIGEAKNAVLNLKATVDGAIVISNTASGSAGGLMGMYHLTSDEASVFQAYGGTSGTMQIQNIVLDATGDKVCIGALFGILELSKDFSIHGAADDTPVTITSTAGFTKNGSSFALKGTTNYGGLIGRVYGTTSDTALPALVLDGKMVSVSTTNNDITHYGGVIGVIGTTGIDSANKNGAYVVTNGQISTTCNNSEKITAAGHYFGGAVGGMFYHSVFEIAESATFTPSASNVKYGGGIVGVAARGSTLRLAGTTELTNVTFTAHALGQNPVDETNNRNANGQIVGVQNAAVIYAAKSWVLTRPDNPGEIDDIGNYGSVIRLGRNIGKGSDVLGTNGGLSETLIRQDANTHKTVFADEAPLSNGEISISTADKFALLSIEEQTYGDFGIYSTSTSTVTNGFIISGNRINKIVLTSDIDLSNTGIIGFQRDFYNGNNVYTGELDGQNHKVTLDIGQLYANSGTGAGNGQIHGHSQVGLFSQANATIKNLTIEGTINVRERKLNTTDPKQKTSMAVGGCVAVSTANASIFENVKTNVSIQCSSEGTESYIGGLLGLKQGSNSSVTFTGCKGNAVIQDTTTAGVHAVGGLLGVYSGGGTITVRGTTLCGSITGESIADAKYGGLISVIKDKSTTMYLNNVTINGQKIINSATASSGGLLGYEWHDSAVYFGDGSSSTVSVQGDSAVTVNGSAKVGALVYLATGYWQINNLSLNKASIMNQTGDLGLLICYGRREYAVDTKTSAQLLYLEETAYHAYQINTADVTVSSTGGCFDEWVVYTAKDAGSITDNGNSVISIATQEEGGKRKGFDPIEEASTGYQNRTNNNGTDWTVANPNARYYYDLDDIRTDAGNIEGFLNPPATVGQNNGYVDTSGEAVLWSVWRYCEKVLNKSGILEFSNIQKYFVADDIKEAMFDGNGAPIDLTGYSYYPVSIDASSVEIKNCTITFANQTIENAEAITGVGFDVMNRTTAGTAQDHTQHYLMHSGLILNYENSSTSTPDVTLTVSSLTLQGTVGKGPDNTGSGAIVCGKIEGSNVGGSHFANINLNNVVLDGVCVNSDTTEDGYAPLLINKVGSYGGIVAQKISTTSRYPSSKKAATSLIGHVGNEYATNISLAFSNGIDLNGRTEQSIFSHATLLESFRFSGASSSGYYHFNEDEKFTYGREITGTLENENLQLNYFDTGNRITDGDTREFNTDAYLPYVCQTKVTESSRDDTFHELEINVVKPDLTNGCGTYDDPYIIDQPAQLQLVAQYIARDAASAGWKINMVTEKEKIKSGSDENHKAYTFGNGSWTSDTTTCTQADMRNYLRNAYYKINNDLQLNKFEGLGTTTYPFRGVVEGNSKSVTIDAENITSGFVNVSYGSVIQNLNITYTGKKTLSDVKAALNSNTVADLSYFGGIMGDVKGGDNRIKNVSVVYKKDQDATDNFCIEIKNHLQCVGGFVGIVEGGGVIFSEMSKPGGLIVSGEGCQIDTTLADKDLAYASPLVGRVLDGFVINEVTSSDSERAFVSSNGSDKNYSIANILVGTKLNAKVQDGGIVKVEVDKEEKLLLLSAIINSGACSAGYSLAYKNVDDTDAYKSDSGKVRNADYSKIGNPDNLSADVFRTKYFEPSRKDDAKSPASTNLPYLVKTYADNKDTFWVLCSVTSDNVIPVNYLDLSIVKDLDMSVFQNGYRGIGGRYNCTATSDKAKTASGTANQKTGQFQCNTPVFVAINGNNHTITVKSQIDGYSDDNYVANAAGGLVNVLRRKQNEVATVQDLTVKGNVELHDFSDNPSSTEAKNSSDRGYAASVGGVIGRYYTEESASASKTYLEMKNIVVDEITLYSDGAAGGIIGQTGVQALFPFGNPDNQYAAGVTYTDCGYRNLTATSCQSTGGIVGAAGDNALNYYYGSDNDTNITNKIVSSVESAKTGFNSTLRVYAGAVSANGLGGLIGNVGSNVEINKDGTHSLILDAITLQDSKATGVCRTGGAIGFLHHGKTTAYNITVSNSKMGNKKEDNLGGIVGCWYSKASGGVMDNIVIDGCTLDADLSVGGVVGYIDQGAKVIRNITVKNTKIIQKSGSSSRGKAMIVGQIRDGGIYGENILLKDNTIVGDATNNGRIVGYVDGKKDLPIQFLGVSVQYGDVIDVSTQSNSDIGNIPYDEYHLNRTNKIYISYDAFLTDKNLGSELAQWPAVDILGIHTDDKITGDTATPYKITGSDDVTGIVKKEGSAYTYIGTKKIYQNVNTTKVDKLLTGIVSTYNANQDTTIENDFNVIQIDGSAACLKQYINAATNGAFETGVANNSDSIMKVDIKRYKWDSDEQKFIDVTNEKGMKKTLTYDRTDGSFYATAEYDNQKNMFTLVSITFTTTENNFSRTYDIPVIVRRMLQVDFMATMVSGTVFNAEKMKSYNTHALASVGEEITGYLTFKYNSNQSGLPATYDWQSYMEAGANLLGYYRKTLDTGMTELSAGTQITLIDCQQSERRYHAVVPEGKISSLELFNGNNLEFKHSDTSVYQPVSLAELLKITATNITGTVSEDVKKWICLGNTKTDEATVVATDGKYYRPYDSTKDGEDVTCYSLKVTNTSPEENYFVVISIPQAENHMLTLIKSGGVTKGKMEWSDPNTSAPPTEVHQLHRYDNTNVDTNVSSEITFNFLENYSQTVTDLVSPESIAVKGVDTSVEMEFHVKNVISFKKDNYEASDPLYQELRVSLRKTVGSSGTDVYFPSDAKATVELYAYYMIGDSKIYFTLDDDGKLTRTSNTEVEAVSYEWLAGNDGNMILPFAKMTDGVYQYIDLSPLRIAAKDQQEFYLEVKLRDFVSIGISSVINNDLLPTREVPESQNQTKMQFTSVLSFKKSGLSYSTLRGFAEGKKGYYLDDKREAVLKLDYLDVDQLGINLNDEYSGEINTILTLDLSGSEGFNSNLSKFEALNEADTVKFDFSLKQKGSDSLTSVTYGKVEIGNYLDGVQITNGKSIDSFCLELKKADGKYPYYNEATGVFSIPVTFKVKTNDVLQYSNYRIYASADILKGSESQKVAISAEKAFITYTVAKININGIWQKAGS